MAAGLAALGAVALLGDAPAAPSARAMALAAAAIVAVAVLDPVHAGARTALARAALAAGLGAALVAVGAGALAERTGAAGVAAGTLGLVVAAGARVAASSLASAARARLAVLATGALAASAPVWLGPLAEAGGDAAVAAVVAASPASYLAAATGYDYLRTPSLYAASPLGSLRFAYPAFGPATAAWLAVAGAGLALEWSLARRRVSA
jgi:hypothetical protein